MNTTTRTPDRREVAAQTRRTLPKLDMSQAPQGLDTLGGPFKSLLSKRSKLMREAVKARSDAEAADHAIHLAREKDAAAFEQAALDGDSDPGRKHELAALKEQDEVHRRAVAMTRAHNRIVGQIRAAINGADGDKAKAKNWELLDPDLEKMREDLESVLASLGNVTARLALDEAIMATRVADYVSLRSRSPRPIEVRASGVQVDATAALEALLRYDPRAEQ